MKQKQRKEGHSVLIIIIRINLSLRAWMISLMTAFRSYPKPIQLEKEQQCLPDQSSLNSLFHNSNIQKNWQIQLLISALNNKNNKKLSNKLNSTNCLAILSTYPIKDSIFRLIISNLHAYKLFTQSRLTYPFHQTK